MTATIHKLTAGTGYLYYSRQIAAHDATDKGRASLGDYYSTHGESPGHWAGSGLAGLGIAAGSLVTEAQMKALFGEGRHPNAAEIEIEIATAAAESGKTVKQARREALAATRLGNPFRIYQGATEFQQECAKAYQTYAAANAGNDPGNRPEGALPDDVRARLRTQVAERMFSETYGRAPLDARELSGWAAANSQQMTSAVAGWDFTFSPVKSVSTLWALAPPPVARQVLTAHRAAVADAVSYLESHASFTRLGRNGIRQVATQGLVIAVFEHRESRAGDPDLHTHAVASAKVQTPDGKWRALDGRMCYQHLVTASEIYNTRLEHHLETRLGIVFGERPGTDPGKRPIREILGIPASLNERWSSRDTAIISRQGVLERQFRAVHGRDPLPGEMYDIAEQATLDTRPAKHLSRPESQQRTDWLADAAALLGGEDAITSVIAAALSQQIPARTHTGPEWIARMATLVVDTVADERATWRITHIRSETQRRLRGLIAPGDWADVSDAVVAAALDPARSVPRGDPNLGAEPALAEVPGWLRRPDGSSVHTISESTTYTAPAILAAEARLIAASQLGGAPSLLHTTIDAAVEQYHAANPGRTLNAGQLSVVTEFATSGARLQLCTAPAGTGKTTAMRVLADAWVAAGGTVAGLAPTAAAAAVLQADLGADIPVATFDTLTHTLAAHTPSPATLINDSGQPPATIPDWIAAVGPQTLVIVDEFAKLGTRKLDTAATRYLLPRGATVRGIGDPAQLTAIGPGGIATDITDLAPSPTLSAVVRFADPAERAASLALRAGDPVALGYYFDRQRVASGTPATVTEDAFIGWSSDFHDGADTIMLAPTRELVTALNARARSDRIARSANSEGPAAALADGLQGSVGDIICSRRNNKRIRFGDNDFVRNGYRWTVTEIHANGSITAQHLLSGRRPGHTVTLPKPYVSAHVTLGYATTIDSAQGITTSTCHGILTGNESRNQLYVMLTRGRDRNYAYAVTAADPSEQSPYTPAAAHPPTAAETLTAILARDGAAGSATTSLRTALDPHLRLGTAADAYLDTLGQATERAAGPDVLTSIDAAANTAIAHLTGQPAYPVLRQHLATLALNGTKPAHALHAAAAMGELHTASDPAAVLHWRLTSIYPHLRHAGDRPLPWLPPISPALAAHDRGTVTYLNAQHRLISTLATQIRDHIAGPTARVLPAWARPLAGAPAELLADVSVWRAANKVEPGDARPTGPDRYPAHERDHQQLLDTRICDAVTDTNLAVHRWAHAVKAIDDRILTDPAWPVLAAQLDTAHHAGFDPESLLSTANSTGPLPSEMPAAALLYRLPPAPTALDDTAPSHHLHPHWRGDLDAVLGPQLAGHVAQSPPWPSLVAALDDCSISGWSPAELLATAYELLAAPDSDTTPPLRPDQLATALAWRISMLRDAPAPNTETEPEDTEPPEYLDDPGPFTAAAEDADLDATYVPALPAPDTAASAETTSATPTTAHAAAAPDDRFARAATLVAASDLRAAKKEISGIYNDLDDGERAIAAGVVTILENYPYTIALQRIRALWRNESAHRDLITALVPRTDPHLYQPETGHLPARPAPGLRVPRRPPRDTAPRDNQHTTTPQPSTQHAAPAMPPPNSGAVTEYFATRNGVDDQPEWSAPAPGYAIDYDRAALHDLRGIPCVCCFSERATYDHHPTTRASDDGLCTDCRETNKQPIPELPEGHTRADWIAARATYIHTHHPKAATTLLRSWWRSSSPATRNVIASWVRAHPGQTSLATPAPGTPQQEPVHQQPMRLTTPTQLLTDTELAEAITGLRLRIALSRANHHPTPARHGGNSAPAQTPAPSPPAVDAINAAITAARDAQTNAQQAAAELRNAQTNLDQLRRQLATTPRHRRASRQEIQAAITHAITRIQTFKADMNRAQHAAGRSERDAVRLAGPPENWESYTTATGHTRPDSAQHGTPIYSDRLDTALAEHKTEYARRATLTPSQRKAEDKLRQQRTARTEVPHAPTEPDNQAGPDQIAEP